MVTASIPQRRSPRYSHRIRVQAWIGPTPMAGWTENVSAEGLFFKCDQPVHVGQVVALRLHLNDGGMLDTSGLVARVMAPTMSEPGMHGVGLQFVNETQDAQNRWLRYLAPLTPTSSSVGLPAFRQQTTAAPANAPAREDAAPGTNPPTALVAVPGTLVLEMRPPDMASIMDQFTLDFSGATVRINHVPMLPAGTPVTVRVIPPDGGVPFNLGGSVDASGVQDGVVVTILVPVPQRPALQAALQTLH
jgi:hypothetical protein